MTIQKPIANPLHEAAGVTVPAGNAQAGQAAAKSRAALDSIMEGVRLRDLPTTKDRLLAVANAIEQEELAKSDLKIGFNMADFYSDIGYRDRTKHSCGTIACIAGWVSLMDDPSVRGGREMDSRAKDILGISSEDAAELFGYYVSSGELGNFSSERAVSVIRHYAETGDVDWYGFNNDGKRI